MTNKNKIETDILNKVIEKLEQCSRNELSGDWRKCYKRCIEETKSLLPKEEEVDWSKATMDELITEAKRRYPKKTVCRSASSPHEIVSDGKPKWWNVGKSIHINGQDGLLFYEGKWAIITEPATKAESEEVKAEVSLEKFVSDVEDKLRSIQFNNEHISPRTVMLICVGHIRSMLPEPTLEQKARKKAEEMWREWNENPLKTKDQYIYEALLIDPKTL